jgi:hypothetical protein
MRNLALVLILLPVMCLNMPAAIAARTGDSRQCRLTVNPSSKLPAEPTLVESSSTVVFAAVTKTASGSLCLGLASRALDGVPERWSQAPEKLFNCHSLQAQHVLLRI